MKTKMIVIFVMNVWQTIVLFHVAIQAFVLCAPGRCRYVPFVKLTLDTRKSYGKCSYLICLYFVRFIILLASLGVSNTLVCTYCRWWDILFIARSALRKFEIICICQLLFLGRNNGKYIDLRGKPLCLTENNSRCYCTIDGL
jgi:hypothetical protein